ncbi:UDP-4-amino-4,6-dideoxy-N-acetyl-beta-L-altrosamine transaminase [Flavobacteriaceae bacterium]|nr:UDP-4-amino-4,6-dideoxy-N-acetyl-beta-L-altrosamine transaminase [Flavobacteriaceae bacterium]
MKTIVFTGGSSLLAQSWIRYSYSDYNYILALHQRKLEENKYKSIYLNYKDIDDIAEQLKLIKADVVINCIGLTSVEECEENLTLAKETNVKIASNISSACHQTDVKMVHISTDHLFDGSNAFSHEKTQLSPLNIYGRTKGEGEQAILANNPDTLVIRTNFFGWGPAYKTSFSDKILKSLENEKASNLFDDVYFTPISVKTLSEKICLLLEKKASGIFNICSNERITKYKFGLMIADVYGFSHKLINPISIDDVPNLTIRPKDMSLSNHKLCAFLGTSIPSLEQQIQTLKLEAEANKERLVIPYGRQDVSEKDIQAVVNVLHSDYITQGPTIQKFERKVADYCGIKHAYACNSATSALHIACLALGVGKGDLVWTSPISFVASSNCALYCNANVDFVDIDVKSYNMSPDALEIKLKEAKAKGRLPKVVIPVHLSGQSCEMDKIHSLSKKYGFRIIEDASHAIGATYKGKPVGDCTYSDITVFSFHPVKIITTCEGGMCLTNDPHLSILLGRYRSHGITRQASEMSKSPDGPWYYEQLNLGLNYRMNDVQAALGSSQMDRLDEFIEKRRLIAKRYNELLKDSIVETPYQLSDTNSSWHLYIIRLKKNKNINHRQLFEKFRAAGVLVNIHYIPIYRQPYYQNLGFTTQGFEEAERYYEEAISIPIFPGLTNKEQDKVVELIKGPLGFQNLF